MSETTNYGLPIVAEAEASTTKFFDWRNSLTGEHAASAMNTIDSTLKLLSDGKADLVSGKVPLGQLPNMDYDPAGSAAAVDAKLTTHTGDIVKHITAAERTTWSGKADLVAGKVPLAQLPSMNYDPAGSSAAVDAKLTVHTNDVVKHITAAERTTWSGKADLIAGKVPLAQLPSMDYDPAGSAAAVNASLTTHINDGVKHITAAERTAWNTKETTDGAQGKVNTHAGDAVKHITAAERATWNAKIGQVYSVSTAAPSDTRLLWVDTGNGNILKFYSGTGWVAVKTAWA